MRATRSRTSRAVRASVAVATLCTVLACGGEKAAPTTPSAPTPPPIPSMATGTALTFVSGEGAVPVAGASVVITGQTSAGPFSDTMMADSQGRIVLGRTVLLTPPPTMDVVAPGYLTRNTVLRTDGAQLFSLWPSDGVAPANLVATLVYSPSACPADNVPTQPLHRLRTGAPAVLVLDASVQDETAVARHEDAVARLNAILGSAQYSVSKSPAPAGTVVFTVKVDASPALCTAPENTTRVIAFTNVSFSTVGEIAGGSIVYCEPRWALEAGTVTHEIGHTAGFRHSPSLSDVMYCTTSRRTNRFSDREAGAMSFMRQRRSGNRWPDNDRDATASLAAGSGETFVCY
jgi:hypothetical protein